MMASKVVEVRSKFEKPTQYLNRRAFDIRIRAETVREFAGPPQEARVLDIGCGDGSITLPLLTDKMRLTLLDISSNMLSIARSKIPPELAGNVETLNQDFMSVPFTPQSFDLIICIGLLAHVDSPSDFIAKAISLLKPGGTIVMECTDSRHFVTKLVYSFYKVVGLFRPATYFWNDVAYVDIRKIFANHSMQPATTFRYLAPLPLVSHIFSQESLYKITRGIFGTPGTNRNTWLGNEYLCLFSPSPTRPKG